MQSPLSLHFYFELLWTGVRRPATYREPCREASGVQWGVGGSGDLQRALGVVGDELPGRRSPAPPVAPSLVQARALG